MRAIFIGLPWQDDTRWAQRRPALIDTNEKDPSSADDSYRSLQMGRPRVDSLTSNRHTD